VIGAMELVARCDHAITHTPIIADSPCAAV
jgi:hypothetical protein